MLDNGVIVQLAKIVGKQYLLRDPGDLSDYGADRTTFWQLNPEVIVLPKSCEQVQAIVQLANQHKLAIVPSGGRTGLSGGAVAIQGEIVVSLQRLNQVLQVDPVAQTLHCQAGVTTAEVQSVAAKQSLFYPVDFASSGSSQIGGNVATNAGGIKVLRYGSTRNQVLGLKVVTGAGELLDLNRGLVKNNTGLDFRHLFIGSEGILGIICEVTLALTQKPENLQVMVLGAPNIAALTHVLYQSKKQLQLTAFEFFTADALDKVLVGTDLKPPLLTPSPCYALIEFEARPGNEQNNDNGEQEALALSQSCIANGWADDAVISQNQSQAQNLWQLRESITDSIQPWQPYKQDISVKVAKIPAFIEEVEQLLAVRFSAVNALWFGHLGDGNLHLNILRPETLNKEQFEALCVDLGHAVFERVAAFGGSISAEHGVGLLKKPFLQYSRSASEIHLMKQVKKIFDPNGIMNPGKVFD